VDIDEIESTLLKGNAWKGELIGVRRDGSRFDAHLTMTPLRDESGEIFGFVGSQRDITQQKELDRLKDLFVSDVSHELRTPTTNIGLYLDLLESASEDKRSSYLRVLKDQTNLLIKLVEDILDLSRLAIGKVKAVEFTQVDLRMLAEQVVTAHRPKAAATGIDLFLDADAVSEVWGDPNQIARIINNLVGNALQYTFEGSVVVRIKQVNGRVNLEVEDTGIGIAQEDLPHIFDRFYRGHQVRQSGIHGTGLGLAIVKEIVERHNSEISIMSQVGSGSVVKVSFPVLESVPWLEKQS
jgi:signal transduction histidine kinase